MEPVAGVSDLILVHLVLQLHEKVQRLVLACLTQLCQEEQVPLRRLVDVVLLKQVPPLVHIEVETGPWRPWGTVIDLRLYQGSIGDSIDPDDVTMCLPQDMLPFLVDRRFEGACQ